MTVQNQSAVPTVEWDDGVVFVFSWNNRQFFAGFVHLQIALANAVGTTTQITAILQQLAQTQLQSSSDPQSWLDTVKNGSRNGNKVAIVFDDALSAVYSTQTGQNFTLQQLFSIAG
ncbi:hypothetical protein SAMN05443247_09622 [Bradyrhizobium erythrophlei]|jgi:hypothetical protein|nr:hypothetical protein SAMN05443247_09622 [Bradyrhizobium erythrophlei]